jgi:hypothetical protein
MSALGLPVFSVRFYLAARVKKQVVDICGYAVSSPVSWMYFECTLSHVIGTDVPPHAYHLFSLLRLR